jgi:hypothetical protein
MPQWLFLPLGLGVGVALIAPTEVAPVWTKIAAVMALFVLATTSTMRNNPGFERWVLTTFFN